MLQGRPLTHEAQVELRVARQQADGVQRQAAAARLGPSISTGARGALSFKIYGPGAKLCARGGGLV